MNFPKSVSFAGLLFLTGWIDYIAKDAGNLGVNNITGHTKRLGERHGRFSVDVSAKTMKNLLRRKDMKKKEKIKLRNIMNAKKEFKKTTPLTKSYLIGRKGYR